MSANWEFGGYAVDGRPSVIDEWMKKATPNARAGFDGRLQFLHTRLPVDWFYEYAHGLKGECAGLFEIRFKANKIAHRVLCAFGPPKIQISVLLFAIEHNDNLKPPDACKTALKRLNEIVAGNARTLNYEDY